MPHPNTKKLSMNESVSTHAVEAKKVQNELRRITNLFLTNPQIFEDMVDYNHDGYPLGFSGKYVNVPGYDNVFFLFWYFATGQRGEEKLMYFDKNTLDDNLPEKERIYDFSLGVLSNLKEENPGPLFDHKLMIALSDYLDTREGITNIYHEVGHLVTLRRMKTSIAQKRWTPDEAVNRIEDFPIVLETIGTAFASYDDNPKRFLKDYPTPIKVYNRFLNSLSIDRYIKKGILTHKSLMKKAAEVWKHYSS